MDNDATIINALRKKGYKATAQRIAISRFALTSREHPSARRICREIRDTHPTVSLATVYKTLQVFKELGLVNQLTFPEEEARFDSYVKPHLNLICEKCSNITDIEDQSAQEVISAAKNARFVVSGVRIDVRGICQKCAKRDGTFQGSK
jgi:Fur family peroxide stress response transcriptional regulator